MRVRSLTQPAAGSPDKIAGLQIACARDNQLGKHLVAVAALDYNEFLAFSTGLTALRA